MQTNRSGVELFRFACRHGTGQRSPRNQSKARFRSRACRGTMLPTNGEVVTGMRSGTRERERARQEDVVAKRWGSGRREKGRFGGRETEGREVSEAGERFEGKEVCVRPDSPAYGDDVVSGGQVQAERCWAKRLGGGTGSAVGDGPGIPSHGGPGSGGFCGRHTAARRRSVTSDGVALKAAQCRRSMLRFCMPIVSAL